MLTAEQLAAFEVFGYLRFDALFSPPEIREISREFDDLIVETRGNDAPTNERECYQSFIERRTALAALIDDDRIFNMMADILGPDPMWVTSGGNLYVGDSPWHRDATVKGYPQFKIVIYLDSLARDSGCLRLIPGSHKPPYHHELDPLLEQEEHPFGVAGPGIPAVCLETEPGDVVVFHETIWHATFGGAAQRRMLSLSWLPYPREPYQVDYFRSLYAAVTVPEEPRLPFFESGRPRLQKIVERLRRLGVEPGAAT